MAGARAKGTGDSAGAGPDDTEATAAIRDADRTRHTDTGEHAKAGRREHVDASRDSHGLAPPKPKSP